MRAGSRFKGFRWNRSDAMALLALAGVGAGMVWLVKTLAGKQQFKGADDGLKVPTRRLAKGQFRLQITNLDPADPPPPYQSGGVPRTAAFNRNVFRLVSDNNDQAVGAAMPKIPVVCTLEGIDPTVSPILWRLQTLQVLGRFRKIRKGAVGIPKNYRPQVVFLPDEWTGTSSSSTFELFASDPAVKIDNASDRVAGGHAILTVAVELPDNRGWLQDFVHMRIVGVDPAARHFFNEVTTLMSGRDGNLVHMLNAIFAWQASLNHFASGMQTHAVFKKLGTRFDYPDDPPGCPIASFDFGVGLSQFTHPDDLNATIAWDWRENLKEGANIFLQALRSTYRRNITWKDWALRAWSAYNGVVHLGDVTEYGKRLGRSPEGQKVSTGPTPANLNVAALTAALPPRTRPRPKPWPVK